MECLIKAPDSFVANEIIKELSELCRDRGVAFGPSGLLTYLVNLLSHDPSYGLKGPTIIRDDIEKVISRCWHIVSAPHSLQTITLQMQCLAAENASLKAAVVDTYKRTMEARTLQITSEIYDFDAKTKDEVEKLRRIIAIDVILNTGDLDGAVPNDRAIEETVTAIASVMGDSDLIKFCKLSGQAKVESLREIRSIVCGIRIFNEDAGITNTAVPNLPKILLQSHESTASVLQIALAEVMDAVNLLTSAFSASLSINVRDKTFRLAHPDTIDGDSVDFMKDLLIMYRQQEQNLRTLIDYLPEVKEGIDKSIVGHRERLAQLHKVLEYRTAVATDKVFPKFIQLYESWKDLQNFVYVLSNINRLNGTMLRLTETIPSFEVAALQMLQTASIETDEERMQRMGGSSQRLPRATNVECQVVDCERHTKLELLGFCVYTLCEGGGLLVPGDPKMGLCERNDKFYAFSTPEAADLYMELPKRYDHAMVQLVRDKIQLVGLLNVIDLLGHATRDSEIQPEFGAGMCDTAVQTELHPIAICRDKDYAWNVWDLRRKAVLLTDLVDRRTRSAQTAMSYGTGAAQVLADRPRTSFAQTQKEAYTNSARVRTKTAMPRGDRCRQQAKNLLSVHGMDLCSSKALTDNLRNMKI